MVVYLANLVGAQLPLLEAKMRLPKLVSMQVFSGNVLHHMMWAERRLLDDMHKGHKALVHKLQQLVRPTKDNARPHALSAEQQQQQQHALLTSFDKFYDWTMEKSSQTSSFSRKLSMMIGSNSNMQQQDQAPGSDSSFHPGHSSIAGYLAKVAPPSHTNIDGYLRKLPNPRQLRALTLVSSSTHAIPVTASSTGQCDALECIVRSCCRAEWSLSRLST